jgi:hypothetical protein
VNLLGPNPGVLTHQILLLVRLQNADLIVDLYGNVAVAVITSLVGAVEDFPINQPTVSCKTDAPGSDAAQRKRNFFSLK